MGHVLVEGNRVLQPGGPEAHFSPVRKVSATVVPADSSYFGMRKPAQYGDLVAPKLERCEGFVKGEVFSFALGEPIPMTIFAILLGRLTPYGK